jgi:hypothetical protein
MEREGGWRCDIDIKALHALEERNIIRAAGRMLLTEYKNHGGKKWFSR